MSLLIKNVRIIGGAREFPERSDVFVNGDRISAIGDFPKKPADLVLDGQGAYLSPGFIDVNTGSDHYLTLFEYPGQEDFLKQGVTTILGGTCGASLAPLIYGGLESFRKWGGTDHVNINWHTMAELLGVIDKQPFGVNFGTMVGHTTIRRALVNDAIRDLTKNESQVFRATLEKALAEGGFGLSTGLGYVHTRKTSYGELKSLAEIVAKYHGVYATHMRDGAAGVYESIEETIKLAKETAVKTLVSHCVPIIGHGKQYEKALAAIDELAPSVDFNFDVYPSLFTMAPIYTFLPAWAQLDGFEKMLAQTKDEWMVSRLLKDMPPMDEDNFIVTQSADSEFLVGKNLREIKHIYEVDDARVALLKLMGVLNMRGAVLYKNIDETLLKKALTNKRSLIASNAPSFDFAKDRRLKSERTTSTFTKFLSMIEGDNLMPLNDAVKKITLEPAQKFNLRGRGEIKEGNYADLTCFRAAAHDAVEVKFTIVNGNLAMQEGEVKRPFSGKALRHSASA